jgi:TolA-binding protein
LIYKTSLSKFFAKYFPHIGGLMIIRHIITLVALIFTLSILQSCGGSRQPGDDSVDPEEAARQQELDEIEALLGITPEKTEPAQKQPPKEDDTLGLLSSEDVPVKEQTATPSQIAQKDREIKNLKSQLEQKDLLIADLKAQVREKNTQIAQIESRSSVRTPLSYSGTTGDVPSSEYAQTYQGGLDLFHSQSYTQAIEVFESLLASNINNSLADNAQYWIGECHYAVRQFKKAIIDFEKVFTFTNSNKNDAAQFKLGLCYLRLGDSAKAREEFQRLVDVYPNSEYVSRARTHLSEL